MDEDEEFQWAEMCYQEMGTKGYGWWKRETEGLIGRTLDPSEANALYGMVSRRSHD